MLKRLLRKITHNKTLMLLMMGVALVASVYIDARSYIILPSDMRNRIIGSRMMEDGKSPYYYVWKEGGPVRYYDTHFAPNAYVSASTATPFFHWAISPIADFLQFQLNAFWLILGYLMLGACWLLALLALPPPYRKRALLLTAFAIAFTFTMAWRIHVNVGQNYIFLPVMMMGCYYCISQKPDVLHLLLFALFAASLVLLRPTALLLFTPFLFYLKHYLKWFISTAAMVGIYLVFVLTSPLQKKNWQEYFSSVKVNVQLHQELIPPPPFVKYNEVPITGFEGIDVNTKGDERYAEQLRKGIENSNFFIFYEELLGHKPSVAVQTLLGLLLCLLLLLPLLWVKKKKIAVSNEMLLLLGFMVYNTYEFFSPVTRGNYAMVQFIFPTLLLVLFLRRYYIIPVAIILFGFLLNIVVLPSVKMEHNIGQFLVCAGTVYLLYRGLIMSYLKPGKWQISTNVFLA